MVRRCSDKFAKTLMVAFNLLFLICGITIVAVSLSTGPVKSVEQLIDGLKSVNFVFLGIGLFVSLISFLGCCGAWKESSCMITCFMVLLTAILIAELAVGGVAIAKRGDIDQEIRKQGLALIAKNDSTSTDIMNDLQGAFKCCGINDFHDYEKNFKAIPESCCSGHPAKCTPELDTFYKQGCYDSISKEVRSSLLIVGSVAIIICFIELLGIIFACCLRSAINERYESV